MTISRKVLLESLKKAMPGIENGNQTLQGADAFIFHDGKIFTYNDSIAVSIPLEIEGLVDEGIDGAVHADEFFKTAAVNYLDAITYHSYNREEAAWIRKFNVIKTLLEKLNRTDIAIIQGEGGTQSRSDGCGALAKGGWTEAIQAKYLLRHLIIDIALGNEFTSYFSSMDMAEALNGTVGDTASIKDFGYFGVIGAEFDENARATGNYFAKPSYYALQTLCSVLAEEYEMS